MTVEFSYPLSLDHIDRKGTSDTITANHDERIALAKRFDLDSIESLSATINVKPSAMTYHVTGEMNAVVMQISVVSNLPVPKTITQNIDAWFIDNSRITSFTKAKKDRESVASSDEHEIRDEKDDPEPIINNEIDLGEIAAQFLGLALDDYPRGDDEDSGDYIEVKPEDAKPNPFAALKGLKTKK